MRRLVSATGGNADDVAGTTVGTGALPDGTLSRGASSTTIEARGPEIIGSNKYGAASVA